MQWAGVILVNREGEFLLNLRAADKLLGSGCWDIIGGTVEDGESPAECLVREVLEETGETLTAFQPFKTYDFSLQDGPDARLHVYASRLDKPASALILGEGEAHRFFPPARIGTLDLTPGIDRVLSDFAASPCYRALLT